jgi:hypothetical protein
MFHFFRMFRCFIFFRWFSMFLHLFRCFSMFFRCFSMFFDVFCTCFDVSHFFPADVSLFWDAEGNDLNRGSAK